MQTAQVIPFCFEAREVRTLLIDDQPWFVATDVCQALAVRNNRDALSRLDDDEKGVATTDTLGGTQAVGIINESGLYSLILTSRKAEAKRFKKWVTAEVLPAIRKHGRYEDADNRLTTLVGQTIGTDGFHMLGSLIKGKVSSLPAPVQRRATAKIWSQTHAAFGVRSAADIPAEQLDAARNFIAAYALEGEWLPKVEVGSTVGPCEWSNVGALINCVEQCWRIMERSQLSHHLSSLGCKTGLEIASFLYDALGSAAHVKKYCAAELAAASGRPGGYAMPA